MKKEVTTTVPVRFADCDPLGHLNNVKYLEYMLNAREDHIQEFFGYTYEEFAKKTGCTWVAIQNEIAYLREVRYGTKVKVSSKTILLDERTSKVEILMKSEDEKIIHAVLWITVIYFNLMTRKSEIISDDLRKEWGPFVVDLEEKDFQQRANVLRFQNKNIK
ncbi:MAG: acyl-CoA thioesterase [Bergeyella zoohelcum]|nr:acyl-CoA thioesterase [Bergeyella zoohelcum]